MPAVTAVNLAKPDRRLQYLPQCLYSETKHATTYFDSLLLYITNHVRQIFMSDSIGELGFFLPLLLTEIQTHG
jgi:hypothetical protein